MSKLRAADNLENEYIQDKKDQEKRLFKNRQFMKRLVKAGLILGLTTTMIFAAKSLNRRQDVKTTDSQQTVISGEPEIDIGSFDEEELEEEAPQEQITEKYTQKTAKPMPKTEIKEEEKIEVTQTIKETLNKEEVTVENDENVKIDLNEEKRKEGEKVTQKIVEDAIQKGATVTEGVTYDKDGNVTKDKITAVAGGKEVEKEEVEISTQSVQSKQEKSQNADQVSKVEQKEENKESKKKIDLSGAKESGAYNDNTKDEKESAMSDEQLMRIAGEFETANNELPSSDEHVK